MMWIQKQHFFEIRLLVSTYSCIYRSSIDMILKVTSNFKMPLNIYLCLSQRNFLYIVVVSVSINSILSIIWNIFCLLFFAMMIEIKCYEVIGMCFFMLFLLTVKCQCKFCSKLNFPKTDVWWLLRNTSIHHIGAPDDLIVFIVFHQFGVIS